MQIRVPQVIDVLCDKPEIMNRSRSICWPSQGEGDQLCGVLVAALNTADLAKVPDALFDQIAIQSG
jgi:hypothetical protein